MLTTFQILPVDDAARFTIFPFEHRGAKFEACPQLAVHFPQYEATFELKTCREWLFFRGKQQSEALFAIPLAPLGLDSREETAQWLELALESGQFHRFVAMEDAHPTLEGTFLFFFGANGRGFVREPWDESGPDFKWNDALIATDAFLKWPREEFLEAVARLMDYKKSKKVMIALVSRDIEDEQRSGAPLEWMCGSHEELEILTRALLHTRDDFWRDAGEAEVYFSSESEYGRAKLNWITQNRALVTQRDAPVDEHLRRLSDLFLDFNTPVGHTWEFQDAMGGRASWDPEGHSILIEVSAPTSHEKLEARLFLREWLQDKMAPEEIEALLR